MEGATTNSASLGQIGKAKPWAEMTDSEKLEALRFEVRNNRYLTRRLASLEEDLSKLKQHTHDGFGQVVIPMHTVGGSLNAGMASMSYDPLA